MVKSSLAEEKLLQIGEAIVKRHQMVDLHTFHDEMTISQVVRFFERNGFEFTKTMIQNYIRIGVLPPPVNKRYYTKNHLILLSLIYRLKGVFSLDEIKEVFAPILKKSDTFDDDVIHAETLYNAYQSLHIRALENWKEHLPDTMEYAKKLIDTENIESEEKDDAHAFMLILSLMTQMVAMKELLRRMTEQYLTDRE